jgi:hypothetical protein
LQPWKDDWFSRSGGLIMGDRTFFRGKKTFDLDMLLRQSGEYFYVRKFGKTEIPTSGIVNDIWNLPGVTEYNFIRTAGGVQLGISCSQEIATKPVFITLLDGAGKQVNVPVQLNGWAEVPIIDPANGNDLFTRHQTSSILALWDAPINGDVYIYERGTPIINGVPQDLTKVYGFIANGENRTQQAIYTIPSDCFGFFTDAYLYFTKKQSAVAIFELRASFPFGSGIPFDLTDFPSKQTDPSLQSTLTLNNSKPDLNRSFEQSPELDPGTDVIFNAQSDTNATGVAAEFDLICIKKDNFGVASS